LEEFGSVLGLGRLILEAFWTSEFGRVWKSLEAFG
jgi:hypothetical protein